MTTSPPPAVAADALAAVLDAAPTAVLGVDERGRVDFANPSAQRVLARDDLVGLPLGSVLTDAGGSPMRPEELARAEERDPLGGAGPLTVARAGDLDVEVTLLRLDRDGRPWTIVSLTDVTDRVRGEQRILAASRAYHALARVNEAIIRATGAQELFQEVCNTAVEEGGFLGAWIARRGRGSEVRTVALAGSLDEYVEGLGINTDPGRPEGQGPTARALRDGVTTICEDVMAEPSLRPWHDRAAAHGVRSLASLPLSRGRRTLAVLTLWSETPHVLDDQMRSLLQHVAGNVSYALDVLDGRRRLERAAVQRSELLKRLTIAQEAERARIAGDVHDDSVQALAAMDLRLGLLLGRVREAAPELETAVAQLQAMNAAVVSSLRNLLVDLEPVAPGSDLLDLLRDAADHALHGTATSFTVGLEGEDGAGGEGGKRGGRPVGNPGEEVVTTALRIAQEALTNIRKHARATRVQILLARDGEGLRVTIRDDGVGLPAELRLERGHRGLTTMRDRAVVGGGWCDVASDGSGTTVRFWLPRTGRPLGVS